MVQIEPGSQGSLVQSGSQVHGFTGSGFTVHGFTGSRVHGFTGSRVRGFTGSRVHGFTGSRRFTGSRVRPGAKNALAPGMGAKCYQELVCWQLARDLRVRVRAITGTRRLQRISIFAMTSGARRARHLPTSPKATAAGDQGSSRSSSTWRWRPSTRPRTISAKLSKPATSSWLEYNDLLVLVKRARIASQRLLAYLERCQDPRDRPQSPKRRD